MTEGSIQAWVRVTFIDFLTTVLSSPARCTFTAVAVVKVSTGGIVLTRIRFAVIGFFIKISFPTRQVHTLVTEIQIFAGRSVLTGIQVAVIDVLFTSQANTGRTA